MTLILKLTLTATTFITNHPEFRGTRVVCLPSSFAAFLYYVSFMRILYPEESNIDVDLLLYP
jgi:hypothetical protein